VGRRSGLDSEQPVGPWQQSPIENHHGRRGRDQASDNPFERTIQQNVSESNAQAGRRQAEWRSFFAFQFGVDSTLSMTDIQGVAMQSTVGDGNGRVVNFLLDSGANVTMVGDESRAVRR